MTDAAQTALNQKLDTAVQNPKVSLAEVRNLLREGADANAYFVQDEGFGDRLEYSALHIAARNGRADVLELLISHGAEVDVPDEGGYTPLHTAAWRGTVATMQALVEAGADVNIRSGYGNTVLHNAMQSTPMKTVEYALQLGLNPDAKNRSETTPKNYARSRGFYKQFEQLLDKVKPWKAVKLPKEPQAGCVSKDALFKTDAHAHCALDHPATWHKALAFLDAPLTQEDMLHKQDSQGRPWLVRAVECRQLDTVVDMLAAQGEQLGIEAWVNRRGEPTEALMAAMRKESLNGLFHGAIGQQLHPQELRKLHQAIPAEARAQVTGLHQLLLQRDQELQQGGGGRGR